MNEAVFFGKDQKQQFCKAAVRLAAVDVDAGTVQAAEVADGALDLLRYHYKTKCRFEVVRDRVLILSGTGHMRAASSGMSSKDTWSRWHDSLDLAHCPPDYPKLAGEAARYLFKTRVAQSPIEQKITDCLHWFRKGEEAARLEDRLLHYWIVLEKIFTFPNSASPLLKGTDKLERKIFLISELLPATIAFGFIYQLGWTLHNYLWHLVHSSAGLVPNLSLPQEIREKCFLQKDFVGTIFLKQIVAHLDDLANAVDKKLIKDRILEAKRFYQDGAFAKQAIEQKISSTKEDVFLIYRYRNSIVHNAHYDPGLLPPFVEKAGGLARAGLGMLINERASRPFAAVEDVYVTKHFEVQRILQRLEKNQPVDFLDVASWNTPTTAASSPHG